MGQIVDKTIMEADKDRDGKISFEEFTKMVENTDVSMSMTLGKLEFQYIFQPIWRSNVTLILTASIPIPNCLHLIQINSKRYPPNKLLVSLTHGLFEHAQAEFRSGRISIALGVQG